ncbi:MAG: NAD(P)-binding domain-containing protein [Actinobacteria bacterium]|nr:NAD(P)-binding domain-containing protein [Actinomycetota bacterium]
MRVALVGGTGPFGRALAARLHAAGHEVVLGSRSAERARDVAAELGVSGLANEDAVRGVELAVLAVNADAVLDTARELAAALDETPVLSVASELRFSSEGVYPGPDELSLAERVAGLVSGPVAAGLHSLAAANLAEAPPDQDALVCGDDDRAKALALELAGSVVAGRPVDAGPLASARALEGLTAVIVNVNRRYRAHAGFRVTGLP